MRRQKRYKAHRILQEEPTPFLFRLLVHDTLETLNNLFPIPPVPQLSKRCVQSTKKLQAHHVFNDMI